MTMTDVFERMTAGRAPSRPREPGPDWHRDGLAWGFAAAALCLHTLVAGRYDVFRDELYFIVCGRHPAFGYADQPPIVPLLAAGTFALGHSVWMLRLPGALAAGGLAWLAVRFARLLGGGTLAGICAALAVTLSPMLMGLGATLNTTTFDPLAWTAIAWCLARAVKTGDPLSLWLGGVIAGIDLEIKYSLVFWAVSLAVGLALTPERRLLGRRQVWWGLALAALIAAPSVAWQALNGVPFLQLAAAARDKNAEIPIPAFLLNQVLVMNPLLAPVWLTGVVVPFLSDSLRPYRFLSVAFFTCATLVIATHGKDYYLAASYPVMFVLGAVALTRRLSGTAGRAVATAGALAAVAFSVLVSPLALPVLNVPQLRAYVRALPMAPQRQEKSFEGTPLPQVFADQLGWHDFTFQVSAAWHRIPASDRRQTSIKVDNYGEAAALEIYGTPGELPPPLSGHNQYYLWGLRGQAPVNLLVVQNEPEHLAPYCQQTTVLGHTAPPDAMSYENGKAIVFCRGLRVDIGKLWPELKNFS